MEENNIIYPRYYKCGTLAKFKELEGKCCELLGLPDDESTNNYANPILDVNGKNWLVVNPEIANLFTELEIDSMVQYEDLILPTPTI
jgi:hypothetical protein